MIATTKESNNYVMLFIYLEMFEINVLEREAYLREGIHLQGLSLMYVVFDTSIIPLVSVLG